MGHLHGVAGAADRRLTPAAALTSALLSVLFLVVYGLTNWVTAQRGDVGTWHAEWERHIPFVPLMILPYMSIDLFFVAAPFLCRDRRELRVFAERIAMAIIVAGACFLLIPLRWGFDRPQVEGWLGAVLGGLHMFDRPHNLFPSLHIALGMLLVEHYARHTRGVLRVAVIVWFVLVGLSALLTHQHHVIDVLGGFALSGYCFYTFRETRTATAGARSLRIATYYGAGALALWGLVWVLWPWGVPMVWPALALTIVTAGYLGLGARIYRKSEGRLPLSTRFVLGPVLVGQRLSLLYYSRQCRPWDEVVPGVWIGRQLSGREADAAVRAGVAAVLDLTAEFSEARPFRALAYHSLPILDLTAPTPAQVREAVGFIRRHAGNGVVYIHCKIGYSRTAAVVSAYLMDTDGGTADAAIERLRAARPSLVVRRESRALLDSLAMAHAEARVPSQGAIRGVPRT